MLMHWRCPPAPSYRYRILYLGTKRALLVQALNRELKELSCFASYVPAPWLARAFIESDNEYALFLFDEELPETTGAELARFARSLPHRARTPSIVVPADVKPAGSSHLVETIKRLLATGAREPVAGDVV